MGKQQLSPQQAVALAYLENSGAPKVVAKGKGLIAEQIIEKAKDNGVFAIVFGMFFLEAARTAGLGAPAWNTEAWQAGLGGSLATFLFLRFLKKRTRVLHVEGREFSS